MTQAAVRNIPGILPNTNLWQNQGKVVPIRVAWQEQNFITHPPFLVYIPAHLYGELPELYSFILWFFTKLLPNAEAGRLSSPWTVACKNVFQWKFPSYECTSLSTNRSLRPRVNVGQSRTNQLFLSGTNSVHTKCFAPFNATCDQAVRENLYKLIQWEFAISFLYREFHYFRSLGSLWSITLRNWKFCYAANFVISVSFYSYLLVQEELTKTHIMPLKL